MDLQEFTAVTYWPYSCLMGDSLAWHVEEGPQAGTYEDVDALHTSLLGCLGTLGETSCVQDGGDLVDGGKKGVA